MIGSLMLLAASISSATPAAPAAPQGNAGFHPSSRATAHATASITIVSGVRFGAEQISGAENATRRKARIREPDGLVRPAELLEFQ